MLGLTGLHLGFVADLHLAGLLEPLLGPAACASPTAIVNITSETNHNNFLVIVLLLLFARPTLETAPYLTQKVFFCN